jgi:hypothetical protein
VDLLFLDALAKEENAGVSLAIQRLVLLLICILREEVGNCVSVSTQVVEVLVRHYKVLFALFQAPVIDSCPLDLCKVRRDRVVCLAIKFDCDEERALIYILNVKLIDFKPISLKRLLGAGSLPRLPLLFYLDYGVIYPFWLLDFVKDQIHVNL